jgi:hypothetical protein
MSNRSENEAITTQELREILLAELEARKQAIVELSNEQLGEIAGGFPSVSHAISTARETARSLSEQVSGRKITAICCALGSGLGYSVGHSLSNGSGPAALLGGGMGILAGRNVAKTINNFVFPEETASPRGDQEAGRPHGQNYGTFN